MIIKIEKFKAKMNFIKNEYDLTNSDIANIMGLEYSHIFRVLKGNSKPGKKFIDGIDRFCKKFKINSSDYIFLKSTLSKDNKKEMMEWEK